MYCSGRLAGQGAGCWAAKGAAEQSTWVVPSEVENVPAWVLESDASRAVIWKPVRRMFGSEAVTVTCCLTPAA